MKRFYKKKNTLSKKISVIILFIIIFVYIFFKYVNTSLNPKITYIAELKMEELTRYYLNQTLKKYLNINTNDYIKINLVNNNIISIDVDNTKTNELLNMFINDLETNMQKLEKGKISNYNNLEFIYGNNGIVILIPIGLTFSTSLLSGMGPDIPVKVSFMDNLEAYIDVQVENYGINNSLIKIYLNINIKEAIDFPVNERRQELKYNFLISSKLVSGKVPTIYGDSLNKSSNIVNSDVN